MPKTLIRLSSRAILDPKQVRRMRRLAAKGWTQKKLSEHFEVCQPTVSNILAGKTYKGI